MLAFYEGRIAAKFSPILSGGKFEHLDWVKCYMLLICSIVKLMEIAKVFWSGRSQAVRLPKGFRLQAREVRIRRHGNAVILEPVVIDWPWLDAAVRSLDQDFIEAVREKGDAQVRPEVDKFFD